MADKPIPKYDELMATRLYEAIGTAETGPFNDPWIRNTIDHKSSAYGPVQITYSTMRNYLDKYPGMFSEDEKKYMKKFVKQGKNFIWYSQDRNNIKDDIYKLGGSGTLVKEEDKALYKEVAKKMLYNHYKKAKGDIEKTWYRWRFGYERGRKDTSYRSKFLKAFKGNTFSTKQEIDKRDKSYIKEPLEVPRESPYKNAPVIEVAKDNIPEVIQRRPIDIGSIKASLNDSLSTIHTIDNSYLDSAIQSYLDQSSNISDQYSEIASVLVDKAMKDGIMEYEDTILDKEESIPMTDEERTEQITQELNPSNQFELGGYLQPNGRVSQFKREEDLIAQNNTNKS